MRPHISIPVLALLLASLLAPAAMAQRSPLGDRQLLLVIQYVVQPSKAAEFEAVAKEAVEQLAKQKSSAGGFLCARSNEVVYTYVLPVRTLANGRAQFDALASAGEALGSDWAERASDAIEYVNAFLVVARPDLSYQPANPRLSPGEIRSMHFDFHYLNFGGRPTAEKIAKEYADLHKEANCDTGFTVYEVIGGAELPIMIVASNAKSVADHYAQAEKVLGQLGAGVASVAKKRDSVVRRIEQIDATILPELSYQPPTSAGGAN
jgi:hypothetical protein